MPIYSRRQIAEHFRALLKQHPRAHALQMTAKHFAHSAETVEGVIRDAAVTSYLHAVGLEHLPASVVLATAALAFGMTAQELQSAVEEHTESMEA